MKKLISFIFSIFISLSASARTIKIAVIDSGYDTNNYTFKLCDNNPGYDFTNTTMFDFIKHGQNTTHIISDNLKDLDYCIIPMKVFSFEKDDYNSSLYIIEALKLLNKLNVDIVNMSFTGENPIAEEKREIELLQNKGVLFVVAAGNDNLNLDIKCKAYPACYNKNIIVVGNLKENGIKEKKSNYGTYVRFWELGTNIVAGGLTRSGTSMSCAVETSLLARLIYNINSKINKREK